MKQVLAGIIAIMGILGAAVGVASGTAAGIVTNLTPSQLSGTPFFVLTMTNTTGQPSCASSGRFSLSSSSPIYPLTVSGLLGAYFSSGTIFVRGLGTCTLYAGTEDIAYVCFNNGVPC